MDGSGEVSAQGEQGERRIQVRFPSVEWRRAVTCSRAKQRCVKTTAGSVLVFCGKLAALEVLRRVAQARCRLVWWALQGLSVAGAPGFMWLRRWAPFRVLADASESFSKPMMFLSLATVVTSAYNEAGDRKTTGTIDKDPAAHLSVVDTRTGEIEEEILVKDKQTWSIALLKEELSKQGIVLPARVADDEVNRFWLASEGDMAKFVIIMRKTLEWRQSYDFMPHSVLREWSPLVFWHLRDAHGRPVLIIRLGLACTTLTPAQRPQFARAIISQVEYGLQNLVISDDPRLTVVMDCQGTTVFGFPVLMMKSCASLVQEHYPMRLASLFVINAPPLVRAVANAIIQLQKPATRKKVRVEGDKFMEALVQSFGSCAVVPALLGGTCSCATCVALEEKQNAEVSLMDSLSKSEPKQPEHYNSSVSPEMAHGPVITVRHPHLQTLRIIILGLLCLWILIAMISGRY